MRLYTVLCDNVTVAGATTLVQLATPSTVSARLHRVHIGQSANATSAMQRVQVHRKAATVSTVTSATPAVVDPNDPASLCVGGTALTGVNASVEGAGAETVIFRDTFNVVAGWDWILTEDEKKKYALSPSQFISVKLPTAPATLTNWTCTVELEELP